MHGGRIGGVSRETSPIHSPVWRSDSHEQAMFTRMNTDVACGDARINTDETMPLIRVHP
jgi:hypothetical protein